MKCAVRPDPAVELVADDPVARVRELKQEGDKDIWLIGGAEPANALCPGSLLAVRFSSTSRDRENHDWL
ncbi:dihydrofolate reductase [Streptomyces luteogriseus]|uniref:Dihydrofolate reductase n=1 Tax=Streptomyces luteogriseus TaxID=68233 RepID=A0A7W7GK44_9ACTN|nr:dihydrofolate reductase [Streptomyces luteogriseus]